MHPPESAICLTTMAHVKICACIASSGEKQFLDEGTFFTSPQYVGKSLLLCGKKSSQFPFQLFIGPDWPCMLLSYALIIGGSHLFITGFLVKHWGDRSPIITFANILRILILLYVS